MNLDLHPGISLRRLTIGQEKAPLLVIDNFVANADELVATAAGLQFVPMGRYYPGIRALAPTAYAQFMVRRLGALLFEHFGIPGTSVRFTMCHYSIVTTPAEKLEAPQRIPHIDSAAGNGLATIHYLFKSDLGGTAFYRHRKTGFEYVDESRSAIYFQALEAEINGPDQPGAEYINGNTPLFEQIAMQDGVFNRMLIYRRNSLHSGCIDRNFVPDPSPLTGRLSINSFIDLER